MKKIHCIGVLLVDALSGPLEDFPERGVGNCARTESVVFSPGGGAANTCSALGQMGLEAGIFSSVGNDHNGRFILDHLREKGADMSNVIVSEEHPTAFVYITVHPDGECSFFVTDGSNKKLKSDDFDRKTLFDCDLLVYQDLGAMPCLDPDCHSILQEAKDWGVKTIVDENNLRDLELMKRVLPSVDCFLPGLDSVEKLMPGKSPVQIVTELRNMGALTVVLKMGPAGCLVSSPEGEFSVPSMATEVVDTTGAGDCFDAGFIAALAMGKTLWECVRIGTAAAAVVLANVGGASGIPSFEELVERV